MSRSSNHIQKYVVVFSVWYETGRLQCIDMNLETSQDLPAALALGLRGNSSGFIIGGRRNISKLVARYGELGLRFLVVPVMLCR
jgi:hypothetical protein